MERSDRKYGASSSYLLSNGDMGTTHPSSPILTASSVSPEQGLLHGLAIENCDQGTSETPPQELDLVHEPENKICSPDPYQIAAIRGQLYSNDYPGLTVPPRIVHSDSGISIEGSRHYSESLQTRLLAEQQDDIPRGKGFFIPIERLESLIQEENVVGELSRCLPPHPGRNISELAKQICAMPTEETKSYRKIFAILVILEKADQIEYFLEEGVHDGDLPLIRVREKAMPAVLKRRCKSQGDEILCPLSCLSGFSLRDTMGFDEYQWAVLAPVFERPSRKDVRYYELEDQAILPFIEQSQPHEMCHGGFGQVSKVKIHPEHHRFSKLKSCKNNYFAIKHLNSQDEQAFNAEFDMLSKFSGDAHDHLITLLAAYKQRNSFYLIFPWAEANLVQYWAKVKPKPDFKQAVVWVAMQCEGLADGLRQIHKYESFPKSPGAEVGAQVKEDTKGAVDSSESSAKFKLYGRHGDIKPANVLWFPGPDGDASASDGSGTYGTLKLTDFGLSEFHTFDSRSNLSKSRIAASPSYRPPEYDMEQGRISRSYDIWTLGCLYLEFIAWLLGGWDLVKLFMVKRATTDNTGALEGHHVKDHTFFELREDGRDAKIKDSVIEFIRVKLHGHPLCSKYIHDFLDLIEEQMLVIETGDKASSRRIMCGVLHKRLHEMRQKCNSDRAYALTPVMRKSNTTA